MRPGLEDLAVVVGLVMLGAGFWWCWPPLGLIVPGALLFLLGVVLAMRGAGSGEG